MWMCLWSVHISQTNTNGFSLFYFLIARFSSNFNQSYLNSITIKRNLLALTYDHVCVYEFLLLYDWIVCLCLGGDKTIVAHLIVFTVNPMMIDDERAPTVYACVCVLR